MDQFDQANSCTAARSRSHCAGVGTATLPRRQHVYELRRSFDHHVGGDQRRLRHRKAERPRGLVVATSSNLLDGMTGRSEGFAPFRIVRDRRPAGDRHRDMAP